MGMTSAHKYSAGGLALNQQHKDTKQCMPKSTCTSGCLQAVHGSGLSSATSTCSVEPLKGPSNLVDAGKPAYVAGLHCLSVEGHL